MADHLGLALGIAGAGIGFAFGGPGGAQLGWAAGTLLGGVLFPPRQKGQQIGRLDDLRVTGSGYGALIPQAWGSVRVGGNVIWTTDLQEHSRKIGGKGGLSVSKGREYWYTVSCAVAVCRGPVDHLERIWGEDLILYDRTQSPATRHTIRFYEGGEAQEPDPLMEAVLGAGNVPGYRGLCYVVFESLNLAHWGNRLPQFSFQINTAPVGAEVSATVGEILVDLAEQAELQGDDLAFGAADAPVPGYVLGQRNSVSEALDPVLRVFSVDLAEVEGQITAVPRGGDIALTVDEGDLGAHLWTGVEEPPARLETKRGQDLELPSRLDLTYFNAGRQFEEATQSAVRYTKEDLSDVVTVQTPLTLGDDQARQAAEKLLYTQWDERTQFRAALPPAYLRTAPGTPLLLPVNGELVRAKVIGVDVGLFGELQFVLVPDDPSILTQTVTGGDTDGPSSPFDGIYPTTFMAWSCPEVRDEDGLHAGFYVAATGADSRWAGATIYYSTDGGTTWTLGGTVRDRSAFGLTTSVLPDGTPSAWDLSGTVDVEVEPVGALESTSEEDVLNGENAALVGEEILGFATATLLSAQHYELSTLLRGWRGTGTTGHVSGEPFVELTRALVRVNVASDLIGEEILVRCVSEGESLSDVTPVAVTICDPASPYPHLGPGYQFDRPSNSMYLAAV